MVLQALMIFALLDILIPFIFYFFFLDSGYLASLSRFASAFDLLMGMFSVDKNCLDSIGIKKHICLI